MLTYINLDEAIQKMNDLYKDDCDIYGTPIPECFDNDTAISALKELSTVSIIKGESIYWEGVEFIPVYRMKEWVKRLQPQKGKWIYCRETGYGNPYGHFECSVCGDGYGYKTNFCPNCGADMREESDLK